MDEKQLRIAGREYKKQYGGANFYDIALEITETHPIQASIIILATWNTGRFRYLLSNNARNLANLQKAIKECEPWFKKLENEKFQSASFKKIGELVKRIYSRLSKVRGVEYTGGSKVMHLLNPELFLIWDAAMRKHYGFSGPDPNDYLEYHNQLQKEVQNVQWPATGKTLPKAIDEYHYITIVQKQKLPDP